MNSHITACIENGHNVENSRVLNGRPIGETSRPRLLLCCYTCSPYFGSEPGAGWNRAVEAARHFDTWVLCDGTEFAADIERYLAENGPIPGLHFVYVYKPRWERLLERIPGGYFPAYNLWHRRALARARQLHAELNFDLAHQATMCGFREPGYLWRLGIPFVWGPIGGAQNFPWRFLPASGVSAALAESFRSVANGIQLRCTRRVRQAARVASTVVAANSATARAFSEVLGVRTELISDVGVRSISSTAHRRQPDGTLRLLWSGVLEHRKALPVLLHALANVRDRQRFELRVLGVGSREAEWQRLARTLGIADQVHWLGQIPHREVCEQYTWADVFAFTSLRDTTGTVVVEALTAGLPILAFDHQGVGDVVNSTCGIKIPVTSWKEGVVGFAAALDKLANAPDLLQSLSQGALARAREYHWDLNGERMAAVYRRAIGQLPARGASQTGHSSPGRVCQQGVVQEVLETVVAE